MVGNLSYTWGYLEWLCNIKNQVVDVDRCQGYEKDYTDNDQHQVGLPSSCQLSIALVGIDGRYGLPGRECTADPDVDDPHQQARGEVLDSEADESVGQVVGLIRPVLQL